MSSRKQFVFEPYEFEELDTTYTPEGKRYYVHPDGSMFPSVTTVLGNALPKDSLEAWRKRVGEDEAKRVSTQAAGRGTAIHSICEKYMLGEDYKRGVMPVNLATFNSIKPKLDDHVGRVFGLEAPLYSRTLNTAGRTDCVAEWNGIKSIIDFKTSKRLKEESWIYSYFLQATCYSMMVEERTDLSIDQIVIVIAVDHEDPQVFVRDSRSFRKDVTGIFTK
jgi:genome maintenance exonuclease 1